MINSLFIIENCKALKMNQSLLNNDPYNSSFVRKLTLLIDFLYFLEFANTTGRILP